MTNDNNDRSAAAYLAASRAADNVTALSRALEEQGRFAEIQKTFQILEGLQPLNARIQALLDDDAFSQAVKQQEILAQAFEGIGSKFETPALKQIAELNQALQNGPLVNGLERYQLQFDELNRAMERVRAPWMDIHDRLRSVTAFSELQGIGHAVKHLRSFETGLVEALRVDLGDWSVPLAMPIDAMLDAAKRSSFYIDRGFDPDLIHFPSAAFRETLEVSGIYEPVDGKDFQASVGDEDDAFIRTNEAHYRLMIFEYEIRVFINDTMTHSFGEDWHRHRVPDEMRRAWVEKRDKAIKGGEQEWPLIFYADFTDYVPIITRRDNWREVFGDLFQRQTFVQEAFQRLYPVRIATMHARPIQQDDALFLLVEVKRISRAIGCEV